MTTPPTPPIRRVSSRTVISEEAKRAQAEAERLAAERKQQIEKEQASAQIEREQFVTTSSITLSPSPVVERGTTYAEKHSPFSSQILKGLEKPFHALIDEIGPNKTALFNRAIEEYLIEEGVDLSKEPKAVKGPATSVRRRGTTPLRGGYSPFSCPVERRLKAHFEQHAHSKDISKQSSFNRAIHDFCVKNGTPPAHLPPRHR